MFTVFKDILSQSRPFSIVLFKVKAAKGNNAGIIQVEEVSGHEYIHQNAAQ
jgi:hypothetical protein